MDSEKVKELLDKYLQEYLVLDLKHRVLMKSAKTKDAMDVVRMLPELVGVTHKKGILFGKVEFIKNEL